MTETITTEFLEMRPPVRIQFESGGSTISFAPSWWELTTGTSEIFVGLTESKIAAAGLPGITKSLSEKVFDENGRLSEDRMKFCNLIAETLRLEPCRFPEIRQDVSGTIIFDQFRSLQVNEAKEILLRQGRLEDWRLDLSDLTWSWRKGRFGSLAISYADKLSIVGIRGRTEEWFAAVVCFRELTEAAKNVFIRNFIHRVLLNSADETSDLSLDDPAFLSGICKD